MAGARRRTAGGGDHEFQAALRGKDAVREGCDAVQVREVELSDFDGVQSGESRARRVGRRAGTLTWAPASASARVVARPTPE
ncbi:hypothetical protein [Streptomyces tauricus]|uniref:hypothetical protein n=1 Tax=Streptomyces tauricus TaxID=68274 RepID=UPI003F4BFDB6